MSTVDVVELVEVDVLGRGFVRFAVDPKDDVDPIAVWLREQPALANEPIDLVLSLLDAIGNQGRLVDVGAHLGTVSLPAATGGHRVVAIEASPRNAQLLRMAAAHSALKNIKIYNVFASDAAGKVPFVVAGPWGHRPLPAELTAGHRSISVPSAKLVRVLDDAGWSGADVIKIDVEGAEPLVLAGAAPLLEGRDAPALVIESNAPALEDQGSSVAAMLGMLENLGYELHLIDRSRVRTLVPIQAADLQTDHVEDVLATKGRPLVTGWAIADRFTDGDLLERLLTSAASPQPETRAFAARVLCRNPRLARNPEVALALRTLEGDTEPVVRSAAHSEAGQ